MKLTFTFNKPWAAFFLLPLAVLVFFMTIGLLREFSVLILIAETVTLFIIFRIVRLGFFRGLKIRDNVFSWWNLKGEQWKFDISELKWYGTIRYRSFKFMYFSKAAERPFSDLTTKIFPTEDTFLVQLRKRSFDKIVLSIEKQRPDLKPELLKRK